MTELDELTEAKTDKELYTELGFQVANGESVGGAICSHILRVLQEKKYPEENLG